jgi:hypothetical protein
MTEWSDVLRYISKRIQTVKREGRSIWFRGHRHVDWHLNSTAHRYIIDLMQEVGKDVSQDYTVSDNPSMIRDHFKSFYQDFKSKAWDLLTPEERLPWGIVFAMQHYGIPTTLLDCSESFAVAVYFANHA